MNTDPLTPWRDNLTIRPVLVNRQSHSLHTYFGVSPENPDERSVLLFTSTRPDAHVGEVAVVDRQSGRLRTLAAAVEVEDGHRQANQQWVCNGDFVVYMALVGDEWRVIRVNPKDLSSEVLAVGRQLGRLGALVEKTPDPGGRTSENSGVPPRRGMR